jgi:hypothetical protein
MQRIGQNFDNQEKYPQNSVLAKIARADRFWIMPDRIAWSYLRPEVVFVPLLRLRSANMPTPLTSQDYTYAFHCAHLKVEILPMVYTPREQLVIPTTLNRDSCLLA